MTTQPPFYLSSISANAMISDLRPTTLSQPALLHINLLLDELITSIITSSSSINPYHLRLQGIPAVFSSDKSGGESTGIRALGRAAVGEAEMELRSWYSLNEGGNVGFRPDEKGRGMTEGKERADAEFPVEKALDLLRLKCLSFSTVTKDNQVPESVMQEVLAAWKAAGGDDSSDTVDPSALWLTAIIEHIAEHILQQLARVVARDSSITSAGVQDLYVALCEDETVWGFFKRMRVKDSLEIAIRSGNRTKRGTGGRPTPSDNLKPGRGSPSTSSPRDSTTSVTRDASIDSDARKSMMPPSAFDSSRISTDSRVIGAGIAGGIQRKGSVLSKKDASPSNKGIGHERSPSVLSMGTRSMLGAYNEGVEDEEMARARSPQDEEDEFDALVRSGETMKVSLTPSRLKNFDSGKKSGPNSPLQSTFSRRPRRSSQDDTPSPVVSRGDQLPPLLPLGNVDNRTPPRSTHLAGSRSTSSNKLTARGATTIEEDEEEELAENGRKGKKESLMELFSSEPSPELGNTGRRGSAPVKRTAPAVILATPPPPASVPDEPTTALAPPSRTEDDLDSNTTRRPRAKPKSEARELADFFNSTPPPAPPTSSFRDDDPPPTAKSTKGFRGLLSKVTGKKNKENESLSNTSSIPSSGSSSRLAKYENEPPMAARRQKSMQSFVSNGPGTGPPSAYRVSEDAPAVPSKGLLRKKSDAKDTTNLLAMGGLGSKSTRDASPSSREERVTSLPAVTSSVETRGSPPVVPNRVTSFERKEAHKLEDEYIRPAEDERPLVVEMQKPTEQVKAPTEDESVTPKPIPAFDGKLPAPLLLAEPIRPSHAERSATTMTTLDAHSFITANEGKSTSSLGHESTVEGAPHDTTDTITQPPRQDVTASDPTSSTIPLSDLVPLRSLLQHATSADECRLLLSALLTQWRVPASSSSSPITLDSPEARVTAWLLAGRDGPVGDTPSSSTFSSMKPEDEDVVVTPTAVDHVRLPNVSKVELDDERGNEEEELISEITDDESEASLSRDELGEGLPPSFAKSGLRIAPVRYGIGQAAGGVGIRDDTREGVPSGA